MIRKTICALLLAFAALTLRADDRAQALVRGLSAKIASYPSYEVQFTADMPGEFENVSGRIVVRGDLYTVDVNHAQVYYDGKAQYTYLVDEEEVTVEKPDPTDRSLLSSPARFFRTLGEGTAASYKGKAMFGGLEVELVELTPKTADAGFRSILLKIDPATALPVAVTYSVEGASAPLQIKIDRIARLSLVPAASVFTFDAKKHPGVEVVDMR